MRKLLLMISVVFVFGAPAAAQTSWTCPEGFAGQTLSVYNWSTYIAEDTIANFESLCGVRVIYDTYPTDDDMLVRLRRGNPGFDVVVPSDVIVRLMIEENLIDVIDARDLPSFGNLDETFTGLDFDPENRYTVPYQWGTVGVGYNVDKVGEITSWAQVFAHQGAVAWLNDVPAMMGVALNILGFDPNSEVASEVAAARDFLIENGRNVVYIASDDGQEMLLRGEADIVVEYSGDIFQVMDECECDTYAYVIPEEGTNFWVDSLAIPVGANNKALALVFLDYMLDPQVAADISNYTAYGSPNALAIELGLIDEELLEDPGIYPTEETQERLFFTSQSAGREAMLNDAWDEIRIFVGR